MTSNPNFDENRFKRQVDAALQRIKTVLENTRNPQYPADVAHRYDDKFYMIESLANVACAAQVNCLQKLGLEADQLKTALQWVQSRSVTLRFTHSYTCTFLRKEKRKIESPTYVTETKTVFGTSKTSEKVVRKVTDYYWKYTATHQFGLYKGNEPSSEIVLQSRTGSCEVVVTDSEYNPYSSSSGPSYNDVSITWLLQRLEPKTHAVSFSINRESKSCHTPRRNSEIEEALSYFRNFSSWTSSVYSYFTGTLFHVQKNHGLDLSKIGDTDIFVPVVPLFEENQKGDSKLAIEDKSGKGKDKEGEKASEYGLIPITAIGDREVPVLPPEDVTCFLKEQVRSLEERFAEFNKMFPDDGKLITVFEASILVVLLHAQKITTHFIDGVEYVEDMLYKQLLAAIGKEVTPTDFANYMVFHNRKLFKPEYEPRPFSYAIRLPDHYPEGTIGIDIEHPDGSLADPIQTIVRWSQALRPMHFNIDAATKISFFGDRYLHAYVLHKFSGQVASQLSLVARARQFSSFIMLVGKVISADKFDPKAAIIIQNKDDLKIPLMLEQVPTAQEFNAAISSLSPEQQRFALAYRSMQLSNTLFAVAIIQIKPQLEKLLKLPTDSLQKEIKLTQDLLDLFITYQIPSDLISYDGDPNASNSSKIAEVKRHVVAMQEMLQASREKELHDQGQVYAYGRAGGHTSSYTAPAYSSNSRRRGIGGGGAGGAVVQQQQRLEDQYKKKFESLGEGDVDLTEIPRNMDAQFQSLDEDNALRPTIVAAGTPWTRKHTPSLLAQPQEQTLYNEQQETERDKAFDLLDALSCSGCLPVEHASLHVILAATHSFDATLVNTVIQQNVNPIEKVERSTLIVATTVHGKDAEHLIKADQLERVQTFSPILFSDKARLEARK